MHYPRVLIIGPSVFNSYTGTGVLLKNLFKGWPKENLAIAHSDTFPEDRSLCQSFYYLSSKELPFAYISSIFQHRKRPQQKAVSESHIPLKESFSRQFIHKFLIDEFPRKAFITPAFESWITSFRPDVIYTVVNAAHIPLVMAVADKWGLPIVAHMMDDWPSAVGQRKILGFFFRQWCFNNLKSLFQKSVLRLAISDRMCDEYGSRYKAPFFNTHNGVDLDNRLSKARNNWSAGKPFKLIYVGSLLPYSQLDSLVDIARVVHELKREGWDIQLEIFSPWYRPYLNKFEVFDSVAMMPALEEGSMFERLVDSDLLLSPANFDKYSRNFIRFSFPAKIPLYMLSGSPILIYGPQTVSYIGDAMGKGWAYVVTDRVKEVLKKAIMELVRDSELRESLGREAQQLSVRLHDNEKMRQSFLKMMSGIVS